MIAGKPRECLEPARCLPVHDHADVLVAGGGPAGIAAALSAARSGARVRLLEIHGCLGGVWTAGLLSNVIDWENKTGIMAEIVAALDAQGARAKPRGTYDAEAMKRTLERLCLDAGIHIRLHTQVVAALCDDHNRLTTVITESKSGRQAWQAKVFIDTTGDGDLAALAGCGFDMGRPRNGQTQPMSLMALLAGIEADQIRPFICGEQYGHEVPKENLLAALHAAGIIPSYDKPTLFRIYDNLFALMANHEYGMNGTDADDLTRATLKARAEVNRIVDAMRSLGGAWSALRLVATAEHIGVRDGRRIHGRYTVTVDDLVRGVRHDDAACRATFCVDIHSTNPISGKGFGAEGVKTIPYDIPLRALIARDVDGLLMAGRCISGDFLAHGSYRVTGNAAAMGETAGLCAARAARTNRLPHTIAFDEIREEIRCASQIISEHRTNQENQAVATSIHTPA